MSTLSSSYAVAPPPIAGGGAFAQSPMQVPVSAGGAMGAPAQSPIQSPMQVPMPSAVQAASGGGQLVQPAAAPAATTPAATTPAATAAPAAGAQPAAPTGVSGGGGVDLSQLVPVLQQLVTVLTSLTTLLQQQGGMPAAQAQAGAAGVQGGGDAGAGTAPAGDPAATAGVTGSEASVEGGGAPGKVEQAAGGCGCSHAGAAAANVGQGDPSQSKRAKDKQDRQPEPQGPSQDLPPAPPLPGTGGNGKLDGGGLTVKGKAMSAEQKRLTEIVLQVGQKMGANRKVLETAVSTMIQESTIRNDSSVDSKDHDSLGLFQQRPSAGWGSREQISNPEYAAKKFFEKAIPNDRKNPDQAKTRLAQSVQISAFPDAYAQWDKEAEKIVGDFLS